MRNRFTVVGAAVSAVLVATAYTSAGAACFAYPSANAVYSVTSEADAQQVRKEVPGELSFRGRLGRVDRVLIASGLTKKIRVARDPVCKSRPLAVVNVADKDSSAAIVGIVAWRDPDDKLVRAKIYAKKCAQLLAKIEGDASRFSCASTAPEISTTSKGEPMVELAFEGNEGRGVERVSVVVVGAPDDAKDDEDDKKFSSAMGVIRGGGETCARLASSSTEFVSKFDGYICVDRIYRDYGYNGKCDAGIGALAVGPSDGDPAACTITSTRATDFGGHCTKDKGEHGPKCRGENPGPITVVPLGDCGGIAVPFDYASILGEEPNRDLSGRTAVSREADALSGPIDLPGGAAGVEFLGSMDLEGKSTNHRKTDIRPVLADDDDEDSDELVIRGTVDSPGSTVLVFPRLQVSVVCKDDGQACQCFKSTGKKDTDVTMAGCWTPGEECRFLQGDADPRCAALPSKHIGFYACEAAAGVDDYDKTGLPCTNADHCGPGGKCTASTVCVGRGNAVWQSGWAAPGGAKECRIDSPDDEHGCPSGSQCGLSLFDFKDRYSIVFDLPAAGPGRDAGVCSNDRKRKCLTDGRCGEGVCVGYTLAVER